MALSLTLVLPLLTACDDPRIGPSHEAHAAALHAEAPSWPEFTAREPAPDTRGEPVVSREVQDLTPELLARVDALERDIERRPTTMANVRQRLPLMHAYYDALQGRGVLLQYVANQNFNAIAAQLVSDLPPPPAFANRVAGLDQIFRELRAAERAIGQTGIVRVRAPASPIVEAKTYTTLVFEYQVGERAIAAGGRMRLGYNWYSDVGDIQFTRPREPGYTTMHTSREDVRLVAGPEYWFGQQFSSLFGAWTRSISVVDGSLESGDKLTITIGDTSGGSPGWLAQSFTNDAMDFRIEVDFDGSGLWVPVAQPRFQVVGSAPHHLRVIAPTVVHPGEPLRLRVNVEDEFFNEASRGPDELVASLDGRELARARPETGHPGRFLFPPITAPAEAREEPLYIEVSSADGGLSGTSNPVMVLPPTAARVYWGELHGHEGYTDGNGTPEWYLGYARDVAFLDFASLTGHDVMLSELHFRDVLRVTREFNDPDSGFVTFPAYEWTFSWQYGGHHNVFYRDESQRVLTISDTGTLSRLFAEQRRHNDPDKVLIIPHAHQPGDWNNLQTDLGPLVEIYSTHGSFEWFGRRYLQQGHLVGFNAASDDHIGHPGNSPARAQARGGIAAVFADGLSRETVFASLKERRTYGTTLARMYVDVDVAGGRIGEVVALPQHDEVPIAGIVAGTAPIASVAVVVNGEDALVIDHATAQRNTGRLWFRITSSTEPNNPEQPRTPRGVVRYLGTVELFGSEPVMLDAMSPVGTEPYGDAQAQVSGSKVSFSWRVRGDYDAMLLDLAERAQLQEAHVRIWQLPMESLENWNTRLPPTLPGEFERHNTEVPGGRLLVDMTVPLDELLTGRAGGEIESHSGWELSFLETDLPHYRRFETVLGREHGIDPSARNHVYVRVKQLDDHTAWSSPTFLEPAR
jgi:hypothetical protein